MPRDSLIANDGEHEPFMLGRNLDPIATIEPELLQPHTRHADERDNRLPPPIPAALAIHRRDHQLPLPPPPAPGLLGRRYSGIAKGVAACDLFLVIRHLHHSEATT